MNSKTNEILEGLNKIVEGVDFLSIDNNIKQAKHELDKLIVSSQKFIKDPKKKPYYFMLLDCNTRLKEVLDMVEELKNME